MKESLANYFKGVASKRLSAVEVDPSSSNQHEFQGVNSLRQILGNEDKVFENALFIYLGDEVSAETCSAKATWYDARRRQHHRAAEYRLYYQENTVTQRAAPDDLLIIGTTLSNDIVIIISEADSAAASQLAWLFKVPQSDTFVVQPHMDESEIGFAEKYILRQLGLSIEDPVLSAELILPSMLENFAGTLPKTKEFSSFARDTLGASISLDPDTALIQCFEREEALFFLLEEHLVSERIKLGFKSVDEFFSYAKSWMNRRYARAGYSFEHHLGYIFQRANIRYSSQPVTEGKKKPDFIFPSVFAYHNTPDEKVNDFVTMLAAKTTSKDRWRQVLNEANRLDIKHLITLEPSISEQQTKEMQEAGVSLIIPKALHRSYTQTQQEWLLTLSDFMETVDKRQTLYSAFSTFSD